MMFVKEMDFIQQVFQKTQDDKVKRLYYQMVINFEIYKKVVIDLQNNMIDIDNYSFAKENLCHMNEGLFAEFKYSELEEFCALKVIGNLIVLITSAHRIVTCINQVRKIEKLNDWKELKEEIKLCNKIFDNKLRNFMEHLEEKIYYQDLNLQCYFNKQRILYLDDGKFKMQFDFNIENLNIIHNLIKKIFKMLSTRKSKNFFEG